MCADTKENRARSSGAISRRIVGTVFWRRRAAGSSAVG